jgi:signal transduction histidine kinase
VRNAVQALDGASTAEAVVRVSAEAGPPGQITILVTDNGPGLPPRARENLFSPFQGSAKAGGTGLGLPIAAELVQMNGGALTLDESPLGTRFRLVLPAA